MTGPEHYLEAARLLADADDADLPLNDLGVAHWSLIIARAQVHATLALAAGTADQLLLALTETEDGPDLAGWETARQAWIEATT